MKLTRIFSILHAYTLGRLGNRPSTASFWYLQAPANLQALERTQESSRKHPFDYYLFDQQVKLKYSSVGQDSVPILHYNDPVGDQVNPEAAFQYGLGLADRYLDTFEEADRENFLSLARNFKDSQLANGDFPYLFAWYESKPPWASALAQARGVSVMLRAHRLCPDEGFLDSAILAISRFDVPVFKGGFLCMFEVGGTDICEYFEEYPLSPTSVLNGFMSTIFGLWELANWEDNERARELFSMACDSLELMIPHYETSWWTLYDRSVVGKLVNVQSPFYHEMVIEYMKVICALDSRPAFTQTLARWQEWNTPAGRLKAAFCKMRFKVAHR